MPRIIVFFLKVFSVVCEQINRALSGQPSSMELFKNRVNSLTYFEITNIRQQERTSREKWESHARPIVELKEHITPEILDLIQQQRLGYLVEGTRFTKYGAMGKRIKDKFFYVRLSPNYKMLHYAECDEKSVPSLEELGNFFSSRSGTLLTVIVCRSEARRQRHQSVGDR